MDYKTSILEALDRENKDRCIELALEAVENNVFSIPELYEGVLKTALYAVDECDDDDCIWKEHVKTSIVRSVIECLYPQVIKLKRQGEPTNRKVVLACPEKEYHEIGLRMIDDFFNILGYETIYVGTNTPKNQVLNAVFKTKADYLAVSVTDYYLLVEAQKMIQSTKQALTTIKVIVGGNAFKNNIHLVNEIGGDIYLESFKDFVKLRDGDKNEIVL